MEPISILFLCCLVLGAVVGMLAGLLGIGGGVIIVPVLIFMLQYFLGIGIEDGMPIAIATSLSTVIFTGLSSARTHHTLGNVDTKIVMFCAVGIILGASFGAYFATQISGITLQRIFAALVILLALQMLLGSTRVSKTNLAYPSLALIGLSTGCISALMGIGGGALIVPALVWFQVHIKKAIGSAALCGVIIAIVGSASFIVNGWNASYLPEYSLGYIYLPATIGIVITSMISARIGAKLSAKLDTKKLKRIFAIFLVIVSIRMIIGLE
ncbi:sulfite exporter TauE/SafE family protein [Glaciecola sp. 2405UD65-10]|uniref:sulfite exporter TauE/SafE family protein n=1 Tax=Glaciecola sp. 2405UD65-10 TaxID=3397244 RepID=UPI003B5A500F